MLSEKEIQFLEHWEKVREDHSRFSSKITRGLPMAAMFGLPIILFIFIVYQFFPDWYMKVSQSAGSMVGSIVLAVIILILFFSYFRMQFKWEMNEQLYMELKKKQQYPGKSQ